MVETLSILYYIVNIGYVVYLYRKYRICPELLWCLFQFLMFSGITVLVDETIEADCVLLSLYFCGLSSFICGSLLSSKISAPQSLITYVSNKDNYHSRKKLLMFIIVVSIVACAIFFYVGGGNVFLTGLSNLYLGIDDLLIDNRLNYQKIRGVGYIYLLRVVILPLCVLYYWVVNKKNLTSFVLGLCMTMLILGTGQRGGFTVFILVVGVTLYHYSRGHMNVDSGKLKHLLWLGIVFIGCFSVATIFNGRVGYGTDVLDAIFKRIIHDNQSCAIHGFRMIYDMDVEYGMDWFLSLYSLLNKETGYVSLSTQIFASIFGGSTRGTAPECVWGSAYFNFGFIGVICLGAIIGYCCNKIHFYFTNKDCDELDIVIYSALQIFIAVWIVSGPVFLINNGFVAAIVLYWLLNIPVYYSFRLSR